MSRYIDADALIMALRLEYPMIPMFKENQKEWEIKTDGYRKAEEVINEAPHIDIVRCKECKRWWGNHYHDNEDGKCPMDAWIDGDGFCSYGEREGE